MGRLSSYRRTPRYAEDEKLPPLGECPYCGSKKDVELRSIHNRDYNMSELSFYCEKCDKDWVSYVEQKAIDIFEESY